MITLDDTSNFEVIYSVLPHPPLKGRRWNGKWNVENGIALQELPDKSQISGKKLENITD